MCASLPVARSATRCGQPRYSRLLGLLVDDQEARVGFRRLLFRLLIVVVPQNLLIDGLASLLRPLLVKRLKEGSRRKEISKFGA